MHAPPPIVPGGTGARRALLLALPPLALALLAYANTLGIGFLSDDYEMLDSALRASDLSEAGRLRSAWDRSWFRPLGVASFWLQAELGGPSPLGFHAVNLALHVAVALLGGALVARIARSPAAGLVAGSLFAAHPLHPETVVWVVGRFDLLLSVALLGALHAWLSWVRAGGGARSASAALGAMSRTDAPDAAGTRPTPLALALLAVLVALACKESAALAPAWFAGAALLAGARPSRRLAAGLGAVLAATVAWLVLRDRALAAIGGASVPSDPAFGAGFVPDRIARYLAQAALAAFLPTGGRSPEARLVAPAAAFALALCAAAAVAARERTLGRTLLRSAGFAALFLAGLLPHAAFGSRLQPDLQGARYLYFASLFACAALAAPFAAALASRGRAPRAVAVAALAVALAANLAATRAVAARWREADRQARAIVRAFPACEADAPVRAVGLPDVATGAYVFRNAFPLALAFERGCSAEVRAGGEPRPGERVLRWDPATERWVERDAQR